MMFEELHTKLKNKLHKNLKIIINKLFFMSAMFLDKLSNNKFLIIDPKEYQSYRKYIIEVFS